MAESELALLVQEWEYHLRAKNLSPATIESYEAATLLDAFLIDMGVTDLDGIDQRCIEKFISPRRTPLIGNGGRERRCPPRGHATPSLRTTELTRLRHLPHRRQTLKHFSGFPSRLLATTAGKTPTTLLPGVDKTKYRTRGAKHEYHRTHIAFAD